MDKSVLKKATSDKSEPTQGHVFRDIARMSFADAKTPQKMADWLVDRLKEAKNPHQMLKTLKVIRHVAASGHSDFQKIMQKYSDDLRPFSQYRGRPDPVLDDKLNQQVRDAGKEVFDAIFSEQNHKKLTNSIEGMGGDTREKAPKDTTGYNPSGGNKLAEAMAAKNQPKDSMLGGFKNMFQNSRQSDPTALAKVQPPPSADIHTHGGDTNGSFGHDGATSVEVSLNDPTANRPPAGSVGSFWGFKSDLEGRLPTDKVAVKDCEVLTYVQKWIDGYTSKNTAPGRADVSRFLKEKGGEQQQGAEDGDEVPVRLDEKLDQKNTWQVRLNALVLIEACVKASHDDVIEYFTENPEDIQRNVNVVQTTVKQKAKSLLALLNLPEIPRKPQLGEMHADPVLEPDALPGADAGAPGAAFHAGGAAKKKPDATKLKKRTKKDKAPPAAPAAAAPAAFEQPQHGAADDLFAAMMTHQQPPPAAAPAPADPLEAQLEALKVQQEQLMQLQQKQKLQQQLQQQQQQQVQQPAQRDVDPLADLFGVSNARPAEQSGSPPGNSSPFGLDSLFSDAPAATPAPRPAPTPHATPVAGAPSSQSIDFLFASGSPPSSMHPPTPAPSPAAGLAPGNPVVPDFSGIGGSAAFLSPPAAAAAASPAVDAVAQLKAQQAALQAQIEALQAQAFSTTASMPPPLPFNPPALPMPLPAAHQNTKADECFASLLDLR